MSSLRARRLVAFALPAIVFAALVLAVYWRTWTPVAGAQRAFAWDAQHEYWGDLQFQVDAIADGEAPLWNPSDRAGYPFDADVQAGTLYPLQWPLIGAALALGTTPWWLITVKVLLHLWLCGVGMYAFLRRRGTAVPACYAGGALVLLSYPVLHNAFSALTWSFAWAPWLLLALDAWADRPTAGRAALVALAAALATLAGGLASLWYGLLIAVPYASWAVVHQARAAVGGVARRAYLGRAAWTMGAALLLFAAITAAQLDATATALPETVRASRDLDFFGLSVLDGRDLIGFAVPRMAGSNTYLGLAAILWAAALVTSRPTSRTVVLLAIGGLGVACSLGAQAPFLPFLASLFDPFEMFRRAHRYLYVLAIPFAILAAEGLSFLATLADDARRRRLGRAIAITGGAIGLACLLGWAVRVQAPIAPDVLRDQFGAAPRGNPDAVRDAFAWGVAAALLATALTWLIVRGRGPARQRWLWIAVVALTADLWFARAHKIDRGLDAVPAPAHDGEAQALAAGGDRLYDRAVIGWRPGTRLGVRDFGGYEDDPLALRRYDALLDRARAAPWQLGHANVRWILDGSAGARATMSADSPWLRGFAGWPGVGELTAVAPRVAWYDRAEVVDDEAAALTALLASAPGTAAVVETGTLTDDERARAGRVDAAATPVVSGIVTSSSRNAITVEVDAPGDGLVVINEAWFKHGWSAQVDGAPAHLVPANAMFRGVFVAGAGRHVIALRYQPRGYRALVLLELLGLIAAVVVIAREHRRERRSVAPVATAP